jgi:hypothetical protein
VSEALSVKVERIEERLKAVEDELAALRKQPSPLAAQAQCRHELSVALRAEIQSAMATYSGPERLTAKRVCLLLRRNPPPKIRTVQGHMKEINAASSVPRSCR